MTKFFEVFTFWPLLVLSLALNVSLILRVVYEADTEASHAVSLVKYGETLMAGGDTAAAAQKEGQAGQRMHLSVSSSSSSSSFSAAVAGDGDDRVINVDHGDPTMYEKFWREVSDQSTIVIPGWQSTSYFSDFGKLCWFLEPEFAKEVTRLHKIVGNAVTKDRQIIVGTGSTQLYQAALYALSPQDAVEPINVISAAPYYSSYPLITDCLKSGLHRWGGDAQSYNKEGAFIELVTSPNNPDGHLRQPVVSREGGMLIHDLAYYWPQYAPISSPADHDIMLFTVSKSTGHAGMRIGWALVKDLEVAKKMTKYIEISTIGVSRDSQLRAAKLLKFVSDGCEHPSSGFETLFEFGYHIMAGRWRLLREAVQHSGLFSLPEFSSGFCSYSNRFFGPQPAFAWLKCEDPIEDCEGFLRANNILTRSGKHFGASPQLVRISMLDRDENFDLFVYRLSTIRLRQSMAADEETRQ